MILQHKHLLGLEGYPSKDIQTIIDTAFSFHLLPMASIKSWSTELVASGYAVYAITSIIASPDGKIFVTDLADTIRIRTGETGEEAL